MSFPVQIKWTPRIALGVSECEASVLYSYRQAVSDFALASARDAKEVQNEMEAHCAKALIRDVLRYEVFAELIQMASAAQAESLRNPHDYILQTMLQKIVTRIQEHLDSIQL